MASLFEIENSSRQRTKRLYLPLVGLQARFEKAPLNNFRQGNWAPMWSLEDTPDSKIQIYQLRAEIASETFEIPPGFTKIDTTSAWLNLWKHDDFHAVLSTSSAWRITTNISSLITFFLWKRLGAIKNI